MVRPLGSTLIAAFLLSAACGGSPAQPTTPPSPVPPSAAPTVRFEVKADETGSRDAVASLSEVVADASASTGTGALTFTIDFGDGTVSNTSTARHIYAAPGTFTITATVTNAQAQRATASRDITVKSLTGSWFEAEYVRSKHQVEVRRLTLTAQEGLTVRGRYQATGWPERAVTATLTPPRAIRIAIDGGASLEGTLPGRLNDEAENWTLAAHGDSVDGERLEFRASVGEPSAAPPDADFKLRFGNGEFGEPISALTPIHIDATLSRGTGLSYFIEFGDDFVSTTPNATHIVDSQRLGLDARVTVIDRLGRSDSEAIRYYPFVLNDLGDYWPSYDFPMRLIFRSRNGVNYDGNALISAGIAYSSVPVHASLSGDRDIRIVLPSMGIEFRGTLEWRPFPLGGADILMDVTQTGGADNGKRGKFRLTSEY